ncbi:hypothetical protein ZOSMA_115G00330 [Zostera marina]|uniref:At1g61320/AtMIF1 LRR domain-containing protein n=1 Tax=Zostera marina TaxID=29655 RepID=A0A0K9Q2A2_ZOSMR|nr:hypothetical protein ZOSMA_115G00330 [Zostera marina]
MPLDDAIRTCCLSKHWRYKWRNIPDLSLNFETYGITSNNIDIQTVTRNTLSKINWILSNHTGNIKKFKLCIGDHIETNVETSRELNRWLDWLVHLKIEELEIQRFNSQDICVQSSIFDFDKLTNLTLCNCTFRFPQMFKGFKYLITLHLVNVEFIGEYTAVDQMIRLCPVLKNLTIYSICESLDIDVMDAPSLETLAIKGSLVPSCIFYFERLKSLTLCNCTFRIPHLFKDFKYLTTLHLDCVKILSDESQAGSTIATFLNFCPNLKNLMIKFNGGIYPLINNFYAPNLRYLCIDSSVLNLNIGNFVKLKTLILSKCDICEVSIII